MKDNIVPSSIKWFKGDTEIAGANDLTLTTAPVTTADDGTKYKVTLANSAGQSVTSSVATLSVVANQFQTGVLQYDYFPVPRARRLKPGQPSHRRRALGSARMRVGWFRHGRVASISRIIMRTVSAGIFSPPTTGCECGSSTPHNRGGLEQPRPFLQFRRRWPVGA